MNRSAGIILVLVLLLGGCGPASQVVKDATPVPQTEAPSPQLTPTPVPAPGSSKVPATEPVAPPLTQPAQVPAVPATKPADPPAALPAAKPTPQPSPEPAPPPKPTPAPNATTVPPVGSADRQLGLVRLGQTYQELAKAYPKQTEHGPYPEPDVPGMSVYFDANNRVEKLFFSQRSPHNETPRGLREGDTLSRAVALYGPPTFSYETRQFPSSPDFGMIHVWNGSDFQFTVSTHRNEPSSVVTVFGVAVGRPYPPASTK